MPDFLEHIFEQLWRAAQRRVLQEQYPDRVVSVTGRELLAQVAAARAFLRTAGLRPGERCAVLGSNSIRWVAIDLALMAERIVVVPLYSRQAPGELAAMMQDCGPRMLLSGDAALGDAVAGAWSRLAVMGPEAPPRVLFEDALKVNAADAGAFAAPLARAEDDLITIIYTSGTSGEPKGVCLSVANVNHILACTAERLNQLMGVTREPDRVFHYLPFNFAASWILLLSCLSRESVLTLSTDLNRLADDIPAASPNYFINVPTLLERVRRGVEDALAKRGAIVRTLFAKARAAWERLHVGRGRFFDGVWLDLGRIVIFSKIRARFGANLRAIVCGSAPLAPETQQFFSMLGIPVLQVYGLTETTAICTMDDPRQPVEPGCVGPAIPGIHMKLGENEEILVRGPNVFPGYWNRPEETSRVLQDGWFHTGDQGEVNVRGNWRISGRLKNLIILNSGHKIAPEPIEEKLQALLPQAQQVLATGNGRGYLCALVTGPVDSRDVQAALDKLNPSLPHYRQVRNFVVLREAFTAEKGLLTAMGKLKRDAIAARYADEIAAMYQRKRE